MQRPLSEIEAFLTVIQTGSYTEAAHKLRTSKSVISRRVSGLEDIMGIQMLERTTRRLKPTQEGQWYADKLGDFLTIVDTAKEGLLNQGNDAHGLLRVVLPSYLGASLVTDTMIPNFLEQNPQVTIDLRLTEEGPLSLPVDYDIALMTKISGRQTPDTSARQISLGRIPAGVYVSRRYIEEKGMPKHPSDLVQHRCISYRSPRWRFITSDGEALMQTINPILRTGSNEALKSAACAGLGIVYSLRPVFGSLVSQGLVQEILRGYTKNAGLDLVALVPVQKQVPLRVKRFLDTLRENAWRQRPTT